MSKLILYKRDDWVCFKTQNSTFLSLLRKGIHPPERRRFDQHDLHWMVYWERLPTLISLASRFFTEVDRTSLPFSWQTYAVGGAAPLEQKRTVRTPYQTLFVTEDAPKEVIKASYAVLVSMYHPDHNEGKGDPLLLQQVIEAYRSIIDEET